MTVTRTAQAADRPCELYAHSDVPRPSRTEGHHRLAMYLQRRVWGEVRNGDLLWLCGTCHDSTHDWLSWLLGEAREPNPWPSYRARREAERTLAWYREATA